MMKRKYHAFVLLLLLQGCAALGLPQPTTFNEKVAVAYTTVTQIRSVATSLVSSGKISPDDAQNVQNQANHARDGIDIARKVYATDPKGGDTKLASATLILNALDTYLKGRQ
jgi:uncharacterized protein YcfL